MAPKICSLLALLPFLFPLVKATGQINAPPPRPLWYGNPTSGTPGQLLVFNPASNLEIAFGCVAPFGVANIPFLLYAMDPIFPQQNFYNTVVQVEIGLAAAAPSFVRWAIPPQAAWPGCLGFVGTATPGTYRTASRTVPLSMIISYAGQLVTVENYLGVTYLVRYVPAGPAGEGWTFVGGEVVQLSPLPGLTFFDTAHVTVDAAGTFWVTAYNPAYGNNGSLFSWVAGGAPSNPSMFRAGWPLGSAPETPSHITAERPSNAYPQGLVWISTWDRFTRAGLNLFVFDPATNILAGPYVGVGGGMIWPDTNLNGTGNGVWVVQHVLGGVTNRIIYLTAGGPPCITTWTTVPSVPIVLQVDDNALPVDAVVSAGNGSTMPGPAYIKHLQVICPATASGPFGARISPYRRGTGWNYAEYIATGIVTRY